jgi:hypothetical protein
MRSKNTQQTPNMVGNVPLRRLTPEDREAIVARDLKIGNAVLAVDLSVYPRYPDLFAPTQSVEVKTQAAAYSNGTMQDNSSYYSQPEAQPAVQSQQVDLNPQMADMARAALAQAYGATRLEKELADA